MRVQIGNQATPLFEAGLQDRLRIGNLHLLGAIVVLAAVYYMAARIGLSMALEAEQVSVVWPPTGIALAAVLLLGRRVWPGIAVGAFLANLAAHAPPAVALGIAFGNTLEALAGAWMLSRFAHFDIRLARIKDVLNLVIYSAVLSTMISATVGALSLSLGGVQPWGSFGFLWLLWWLGDATGALLVAPVLLVWSRRADALREPGALTELIILVTGLLAVCVGVFTDPPIMGMTGHAFIYVLFPFIIWAALRFGQHGTTLVALIASGVAVWAMTHALGPFISLSINQSLLLLQIFLAAVAATGLLLGAAIAERKQLEKVKSRFSAIIKSSKDAIVTKNLQGIISSWNEGAERLFGYTAAEAIGRHITLLIPPERHYEEDEILAKLARGENIEHYETVRMTKDGRRLNISLSLSPMRDDEGRIIGATKVARDITERIQAQQALREADRRKDEFLATLAHELRNPLAPLSTALHIVQMPKASESQRQEAFQIMQRQLQQLVRLVDDLLDVSRIAHGKVELRKTRMLLSDAITSALETSKLLIEENRHQLTIDLPPQPLWLYADLTRLSQIFANLLQNAAKYTPPGGQIELRARVENDTLVVRVRDTGIGIPPQVLPRIFELFTQADASMEKSHGGLGIGLTLVKTMVEMHGGRVEAKSDGEGKGSEFIVRLPLTELQKTDPTPPASRSALIQQRQLRVLVADDSNAVAQTLGCMVELMGHDVRLALNGEAAVETATAYKPEVVILDIGLPDMSGYEVCQRLRADPALKNTIFIAQTGWSQREHRERAKAAGFHHHLVKPVDVHMLQELFESISAFSKAA